MVTTRVRVADLARSFVGTVAAKGYDGPNPFSTDLGRPVEAWCGDFATDVFKRAGLVLPSMQAGCRTGFAYVPAGLEIARAKNAVVPSWKAQPGDLVCWDWSGDGTADHVELAYRYDNLNGTLITIGGNSGTGDAINAYPIRGGVNEHRRSCPVGKGNPMVIGVIDAGRFVHFGAPAVYHRPAPKPPAGSTHRVLMLKSPPMRGADVAAVQAHLTHVGIRVGPAGQDGVYGPDTRNAVETFQARKHLRPDGIVGPLTWKALGV